MATISSPILEKDRLIARINMKAQRQDGKLHVTGLWLEPGVRLCKKRQQRQETLLGRHARFIGVDDVVFENGWIRQE